MYFSHFLTVLFILKILYGKSLSQYQTREDFRKAFNASNFVFDLDKSTPSGVGLGGTINSVTLQNMKTLLGEGMSFAIYTLKPCGLANPHSHPRASELIYVIEGGYIDTGFLEEDSGRVITNRITQGQTTIFPQGLIHYVHNRGCDSAKVLVALNNEDPGVISISPQSFTLPDMSVACTYGVSTKQLNILKQRLPRIPSPGVGECRLRCGINADSSIGYPSINRSNELKFQEFNFLVVLFSSIFMNFKRYC